MEKKIKWKNKVGIIKPTIINEWTKMLGKRIIAKFCKL